MLPICVREIVLWRWSGFTTYFVHKNIKFTMPLLNTLLYVYESQSHMEIQLWYAHAYFWRLKTRPVALYIIYIFFKQWWNSGIRRGQVDSSEIYLLTSSIKYQAGKTSGIYCTRHLSSGPQYRTSDRLTLLGFQPGNDR